MLLVMLRLGKDGWTVVVVMVVVAMRWTKDRLDCGSHGSVRPVTERWEEGRRGTGLNSARRTSAATRKSSKA